MERVWNRMNQDKKGAEPKLDKRRRWLGKVLQRGCTQRGLEHWIWGFKGNERTGNIPGQRKCLEQKDKKAWNFTGCLENDRESGMVWPRWVGRDRLTRRKGPLVLCSFWQDQRHLLNRFLWKEFWQCSGGSIRSFANLLWEGRMGWGVCGLQGRSRVRGEAERPVGSVLKKGLN